MVQITEISEDLLSKVPHVVELLYELYGPKTIALFAFVINEELGFVAREGINCVYIHEGGYNRFTLTNNEEVGAVSFSEYDVFLGNDVYFVSKDKVEHHIELIRLLEPDLDEYDGCVSYKQYNPSNDTLCEIRYQHMYREIDGHPFIYRYHTKKLDSLYIDEKYTRKGLPKKGLLPSRSKYFSRIEFDDDMIGYKLFGIKEFSLFQFLEKGPYELKMDSNMVRYARTKYIDVDGNYHDFWPLGQQLKQEELDDLIISYGFNISPIDDLIDIYNGKNKIVNIIKDITKEMKPISDVMRNTQDTDKCALLTLKKQ